MIFLLSFILFFLWRIVLWCLAKSCRGQKLPTLCWRVLFRPSVEPGSRSKDGRLEPVFKPVTWQRLRVYCMEEWTIKTPNPICRLFFQLTCWQTLRHSCLTDFIDWRYTHSWFEFSTQLVNCCPPWMGRNYTCVLLSVAPLLYEYLLSDLLPPPPFPMYSIYRQYVIVGGRLQCILWTIFCRSFTLWFWPDSELVQNCFTAPNKMTNEDDIKGIVQPFELGGVTRLFRSAVKFCMAGN